MVTKYIIASLCVLLARVSCYTKEPILGILAQELYPVNTTHSSYVSASYVKAVESAGARVVPIAINRTEEYYRDILSKINGVVFPGGGVIFTDPGGYGEAGRYILNIAKEMNDNGDHFPILGVCLGYELLMFLDAGGYDILTPCKSSSPLTLKFVRGYKQSKLYQKMPARIVRILERLPVTSNHHKKCITEENLSNHTLDNIWRTLTLSTDDEGSTFISSSENTVYPFVGLQFHPEKNAYEWTHRQKNPHSWQAIISARYFYDWVSREARRNDHSFASDTEEMTSLIYNYNSTFVGKNNSTYEQVYYFDV